MAKIHRVPRSMVKAESRYLSAYSRDVTSQFGEDGILERIFQIMPPKYKWCVEFGAWDGKYLSNTWTLVNEQNWSAALIEGDPERASSLAEEYRSSAERVHVVQTFVGWDGEDRLDAILALTSAPRDFDLLSVDIDGNDWHVWNAIRNYRPRVVVIEYNPTASNQLYFVQDADQTVNQGCSLLTLVELGKSKGYELIATTETNGIFVDKESYPLFGIDDNSIDAMHPELCQTEICYGYDGTVIAAGHMMLHWQEISLTQDDYQQLPRHARKYSYSEPDIAKVSEVDDLRAERVIQLRDNETLTKEVHRLQAKLAEVQADGAQRLQDVRTLTEPVSGHADEVEALRAERVIHLRDNETLTDLVQALQARSRDVEHEAAQRLRDVLTLTDEIAALRRR